MKKQQNEFTGVIYRAAGILILISILMSCGPSNTAPLQNGHATTTASSPAAAQPTTPALPAVFKTQALNPLDVPRAYTEDTCQYLRNKWKPASAAPGTVVMIIMFKEITNPVGLQKIMTELQVQKFKAINTKQFLAFMERNVRIPSRSVLIMQDGSFEAGNFERHFREYWDALGWPVVNGWVSQPDISEAILQDNVKLEQEGWVDHQALGVTSDTILTDETSKAVITRELEDPLTMFAEHYAKIPYAFIWSNGGFGLRPVQAARQLGYQLGFTSNPRGPVMYNWVPLADAIDPQRPALIPEGLINDPLMTLPRYPAEEALNAIDAVRVTGEEAALYQQANKAAELNYYDVVCRSTYGAIPGQ